MTGEAANEYFAQFGQGIVVELPDALRKLAALAEAS